MKQSKQSTELELVTLTWNWSQEKATGDWLYTWRNNGWNNAKFDLKYYEQKDPKTNKPQTELTYLKIINEMLVVI